MEAWKDIYGFEGLYQISNHGRVKSLKRKGVLKDRILKGKLGGTTVKYYAVVLRRNKKSSFFYIHRLVAFHFIKPSLLWEEINHKDYDPLNNHVDNLEWVTSSENSLHSRHNMSKARQGEKHPRAKVTDQQAIEIKRLRKQGLRYKAIAERFNITKQDVANIITRYYSHVNHLI